MGFFGFYWVFLGFLHFFQLLMTKEVIFGVYKLIQAIISLFAYINLSCPVLRTFFEHQKLLYVQQSNSEQYHIIKCNHRDSEWPLSFSQLQIHVYIFSLYIKEKNISSLFSHKLYELTGEKYIVNRIHINSMK